jgi:hypothetical protein
LKIVARRAEEELNREDAEKRREEEEFTQRGRKKWEKIV